MARIAAVVMSTTCAGLQQGETKASASDTVNLVIVSSGEACECEPTGAIALRCGYGAAHRAKRQSMPQRWWDFAKVKAHYIRPAFPPLQACTAIIELLQGAQL